MKKLFFISFLFVFIPIGAQEVTPEKIVENFFLIHQERGDSFSIDYLFANNPLLYSKVESLNQLKQSFLNIQNLLGKFYGYDIILNQKLYDSLQIIIVFTKYEKQPLRFLFVFYKPEQKWITYRFEIDTQYPDNFIDSIYKK